MKRRMSLMLPAALVATSLFATPALAQQRDRAQGRSERQSGDRQSEGRATERAQPRTEQPRTEQPRSQAPQAQSRGEQSRNVTPRVESRRDVAPRVESRRDVVRPRGNVAVPRTYAPRYSPRYAPRYAPFWQSRNYYRPYVFRPRLSIGFGIFAGYPVPYTYAYPYSYSVGRPPASYYGGVVLEIEPDNAAVYVDGAYAGEVRDFDGQSQPLTLTAGTHRIEVQEEGLAPLVFDVTVQPGQVIPYRGDLRPY